jgi:hypothetical protein
MQLIPFDVEAMLKALVELRSELEAARAMGDAERVQELLDSFIGIGNGLVHALHMHAVMFEKSDAVYMRLPRELVDRLRALDSCLLEWALTAHEFSAFLTRGRSAGSGGGSRSPCAPAAMLECRIDLRRSR